MAGRIAVVCARPHPNPGMYSVDLAVEHVLRRHGRAAGFRRYCYGGPHHATGLASHDLDYASLTDAFDEVLDADAILYWGDYLHAYTYWRSALRVDPHRSRAFVDDQADTDDVARHLLLAGQPQAVFDKTLSFGSSLVGDDLRALTSVDSSYREAFPHFVRSCRGAWFRDPVSAAQAAEASGDWSQGRLGVDGAHLLTRADYVAIAGSPDPRPDAYACVHFGRVEDLGPSARLAGGLVNAAGLDAVWLPWIERPAEIVATFGAAIPGLSVPDGPVAYEQLIATLLGARLVISDTYHLCVIAWRLGVPAVCVGVGAQRAVRPISDKKKELFYLTQRISPLYLFREAIADPANHKGLVGEALEMALDPAVVAAVVAAIEAQSAAAAEELVAALVACGA